MILTPKMFAIKEQIDRLAKICALDPNDYMSFFELEELKIQFRKLEKIETLGIKVILGGKHPSNTSTGSAA